MSKTDKLFDLLADGHELTTSDIRRRTGLRNPYHAVRRLRLEGHPIYSNRTTGHRVEYKLGRYSPLTRYSQLRRVGEYKAAVKSLYSARV